MRESMGHSGPQTSSQSCQTPPTTRSPSSRCCRRSSSASLEPNRKQSVAARPAKRSRSDQSAGELRVSFDIRQLRYAWWRITAASTAPRVLSKLSNRLEKRENHDDNVRSQASRE